MHNIQELFSTAATDLDSFLLDFLVNLFVFVSVVCTNQKRHAKWDFEFSIRFKSVSQWEIYY